MQIFIFNGVRIFIFYNIHNIHVTCITTETILVELESRSGRAPECCPPTRIITEFNLYLHSYRTLFS